MNYDKARRVIWWAIERLEALDDWLYLRRPTTFHPVAPLLPSMPELRFDQQSKVRKMTNNGEPIRLVPYNAGDTINTTFVKTPEKFRDVIEHLSRDAVYVSPIYTEMVYSTKGDDNGEEERRQEG